MLETIGYAGGAIALSGTFFIAGIAAGVWAMRSKSALPGLMARAVENGQVQGRLEGLREGRKLGVKEGLQRAAQQCVAVSAFVEGAEGRPATAREAAKHLEALLSEMVMREGRG
jgi:hypothetical protein